ncbi:hypothetical protein MXB_1206, partial [Myxobolus squamalis]
MKYKEYLIYLDENRFYIYTSKSYRYSSVNTPAKLLCRQLVGIIFLYWHSFVKEVFYTAMWFLERIKLSSISILLNFNFHAHIARNYILKKRYSAFLKADVAKKDIDLTIQTFFNCMSL